MRYRYLLAIVALAIFVVGGGAMLLHGHHFAILDPHGPVASRERTLILFATALSLLVVIPVFGMTIGIAWNYRAGNQRATYQPNWDHSRVAETIWWGIPTLLIGVLAVVTWVSTHELDPTKPLASTTATMTIQVIALPWKWLFIYPQQQLATVNYVEMPVNTPVRFEITSDAPMNSFWIPELGGQIYAMTGMSTQLNLLASNVGNYQGLSANISGRGFAGMKFTAKAVSAGDFSVWVAASRRSPGALDPSSYDALARPSTNNVAATYTLADRNLYDGVVMKYMTGNMQ